MGRLPWPSWRARSVIWRPSLPTHRHALENLLRLTSVLNASARSSCSLPVRTRRTRIACPTLPLSSSQRSRLTSSRLRRLRREPSLLPSSKHQTSERAVKIRRKSVRVQQKNKLQLLPQSENTEVATR